MAQDHEEQLARARRNQRRCRERKREYVTELEQQVETLQNTIRQCEPCGPSPRIETSNESSVETAVRENAARRELLLALGFDDECQQRFIQSAGKRQAVSKILQESRDQSGGNEAFSSGETFGLKPTPTEKSSGSTLFENNSSIMNGTSQQAQDQIWDLKEAPLLENGQGFNNFSTNDLLMNNSQDMLTNFDQETSDYWMSNPSQLAGSSDIMTNVPYSNVQTAEFGPSTGSVRQDTKTEIRNALKRCFLDAPISYEGSDSTTTCSSALSMLLRNNRKGLSITELQRRLEPGMLAAPDVNAECRLQNDVLFSVLADISVVK